MKSIKQIGLRPIEDFDPHESLSEICFLAVSHSINLAFPSAAARSRSSRTSLCHCGTGTLCSSRHSASHRASIVRNFSCRLIFSISTTPAMKPIYPVGGRAQGDLAPCGPCPKGRRVSHQGSEVAKGGLGLGQGEERSPGGACPPAVLPAILSGRKPWRRRATLV